MRLYLCDLGTRLYLRDLGTRLCLCNLGTTMPTQPGNEAMPMQPGNEAIPTWPGNEAMPTRPGNEAICMLFPFVEYMLGLLVSNEVLNVHEVKNALLLVQTKNSCAKCILSIGDPSPLLST